MRFISGHRASYLASLFQIMRSAIRKSPVVCTKHRPDRDRVFRQSRRFAYMIGHRFTMSVNRTVAFPDIYCRNMDAWIDCLSSLEEPSAQFTGIHCERGKVPNAVRPTAEKAGASFMDARRGSL